jgi:hypothetical protein
LAELDGGAGVGADSTKLSCDDGFDLVNHCFEKVQEVEGVNYLLW